MGDAPSEYIVPSLLQAPPSSLTEASLLQSAPHTSSNKHRALFLFKTVPPAGIFEMVQALLLAESVARNAPMPPVVFRHVAVVGWVSSSLTLLQAGNSISVDIECQAYNYYNY